MPPNLKNMLKKIPWQFQEDSLKNGEKKTNRALEILFFLFSEKSGIPRKSNLKLARRAWNQGTTLPEYISWCFEGFVKIRWETAE